MSIHLNLATGQLLNSSNLIKIADSLILDRKSGKIVLSNLLVPRAGALPTLFDDATLDLNFAETKSIGNLVTFSRASTGTYVGSDGLIKTSPVNLKTYSNDFTQEWATAPSSILSTNNPDPFGGLTAARIDLPALDARLQINGTSATGISTFSVWMRLVSGSDQVRLLLQTSPGASSGDTVTITSEWQRFSTTQNVSSGGGIQIRNPTATPVVLEVYGAQLEEGTTATDYIPTTTTASGAPRFDHDPVTGESLGLLIEESRTNYIDNSNDLSQWNRPLFSPVFDANTTDTLSPDGTYNSTKITGGTNSGVARDNIVAASASTPYTASFFAKKGTADNVTVELGSGGNRVATNFNISTKTFSTSSAAGYFASFSTSYVDYPNGWVRVIVSGTTDGSASSNIGLSLYGVTNGATYFWGAQVEANASFPTSYIPTSGSTVTRAADLASIEGTNFSSWYNQSEGTVFIKGSTSDLDANTGWSSFFQASSPSNNRISIRQGTTIITSAGTTVSLANSASPTANETEEIAFAYKENDFAQYTSYANPVFQGTGLIPVSVDTLLIASVEGSGSTFNLNGHISRFAYFPTRKSDQDLIKITDGTLAPAIITYGITSAGGTFNLLSTDTVDYAVDWDSTGGYETSTLNTLPHTYTAGDYDLVVYSDGVYRPYFNNVTADASQITSVAIGSGADLGTDLTNAWYGANNMTSFVCPFDVTSGVTNLENTWNNCLRLASFPQINTSSVINFSRAWRVCQSLTSFPQIDTSSGINFSEAWRLCQSLTSFPQIDTSSGINFSLAWYNCNQITSFPLLDMSSATTFNAAWVYCAKLATFPAHMFDTTGALVPTAFNDAFSFCALTAQSIENILVSLDTNGATGITLGINGGTNAAKTTWSAAAVTAYDNLIVKGWTISFNA